MKKEVSKTFKVRNNSGLHCRPSASIVKLANQFKSEILFEKDGEVVNAKSIFGLMLLAAEKDSKITCFTSGEDAELAMNSMENFFTNINE